MIILNVIVPLFLIALLGYFAGKIGLMNAKSQKILTNFVFFFSVPALLFRATSTHTLMKILDLEFFLAFFGSILTTFVLAFLICHFLFRHNLSMTTMMSLNSSMSNAGFIGIPVLTGIFGPEALVPVAFAIVIFTAILFPTGIFLLEKSRKVKNDGPKTEIIKTMLKNPLFVAPIIGVIYSATSLSLPFIFLEFLRILGAAAVPCILFSIGLGFSQNQFTTKISELSFIFAIKMLIQPFVAFLFTLLFKMDPLLSASCVIIASLPSAKVLYALASKYRVYQRETASTILLTTLGTLATLPIILYYYLQKSPEIFVR